MRKLGTLLCILLMVLSMAVVRVIPANAQDTTWAYTAAGPVVNTLGSHAHVSDVARGTQGIAYNMGNDGYGGNSPTFRIASAASINDYDRSHVNFCALSPCSYYVHVLQITLTIQDGAGNTFPVGLTYPQMYDSPHDQLILPDWLNTLSIVAAGLAQIITNIPVQFYQNPALYSGITTDTSANTITAKWSLGGTLDQNLAVPLIENDKAIELMVNPSFATPGTYKFTANIHAEVGACLQIPTIDNNSGLVTGYTYQCSRSDSNDQTLIFYYHYGLNDAQTTQPVSNTQQAIATADNGGNEMSIEDMSVYDYNTYSYYTVHNSGMINFQMPVLPAGAQVTSASLQPVLWGFDCNNRYYTPICGAYGDNGQLRIWAVSGSWSASSQAGTSKISSSQVTINQPFNNFPNTNIGTRGSFDVTSIVQGMYSGTYPMNGFWLEVFDTTTPYCDPSGWGGCSLWPNMALVLGTVGSSNPAVLSVTYNVPPPPAQTPPPLTMTPGQKATVTVNVRNTGTSTWGPYSYNPAHPVRLGSQNPQDNSIWGFNRVELSTPVPPGQVYSFVFTITAPSTPGTYNFQWRMVQDGLEWFGQYTQNIQVVVTNPQVTIRIDAYPTTDYYGRSQGMAIDRPLPCPWWPPYQSGYQFMVTSGSFSYTTTVTLAPGSHYVQYAASGSLPSYAWHARIYINGVLKAEGDVGRSNPLTANFNI